MELKPQNFIKRLTSEESEQLNADLEMYYHDYGTKKIQELWPKLERRYIVYRANNLGLKVSKAVLSRSNTRSGKYVTVEAAKPKDAGEHARLLRMSVSKPWSNNNGRHSG